MLAMTESGWSKQPLVSVAGKWSGNAPPTDPSLAQTLGPAIFDREVLALNSQDRYSRCFAEKSIRAPLPRGCQWACPGGRAEGHGGDVAKFLESAPSFGPLPGPIAGYPISEDQSGRVGLTTRGYDEWIGAKKHLLLHSDSRAQSVTRRCATVV